MHIHYKFIIYYALMLICIIAGARNFKTKPGLRALFILLPISLCTELVVEYRVQKDLSYRFIYHFYEVIDFTFLCLLFYKNAVNQNLKTLVKWLPGCYAITAFILTLLLNNFHESPSIQYSVEGVLLILLGIWYLFQVPVVENLPIKRHSMFWVTMGLIIFHSGIMLLNGCYNYLKSIYPVEAQNIYEWVNMAFNYLLYSFILTGILCPPTIKRYS